MEYPLIVSFYTEDWKYPKYAKRMQNKCKELELDCYIQKMESKGGWLQNTCMKPQFILDCLLKFKRPILWLDVDTNIVRKPTLLNGFSKDFAGCKTPDFHTKELFVGTLVFSYTEKALDFVSRWVENTGDISDHSSFDETWKEYGHTLDTLMLPETYSSVLDSNPKPGRVFVIELSKGRSKMKQMAQLKKQRGY